MDTEHICQYGLTEKIHCHPFPLNITLHAIFPLSPSNQCRFKRTIFIAPGKYIMSTIAPPGSDAIITGFGYTDYSNQTVPEVLQEGQIKISNDSE